MSFRMLPLVMLLAAMPMAAVTADAGVDRLLIVHAAHLAAPARAWADHRSDDGWAVSLRDAGGLPCEAVQAVIRREHREHMAAGGGAFSVLLLGDAGPGGIPAWYEPQNDPQLYRPGRPAERRFATDHPYQQLDEDDLPDVALGRVPATTADEAMGVLAKIRRYERQAPPGPWRRRITYAAGEGRFGAMDLVLERMFRSMVQRLVPPAYDLSMTYAKPTSAFCPPPRQVTETLLARLGEGALLFNYVGHGSEHGLDRMVVPGLGSLPTLRTPDLDRLESDGTRLPVALLTCCSAGWYDLPDGQHSLAEAMLFHEGGPIAVIAGSRLTHPYANVVIQKDVNELLLVERVPTLGELELRAMRSMLTPDVLDRQLDAMAGPIARVGRWHTSLRDLRRMHVRLYNLLGDPALRLAYPRGTMTELGRDDDGRVSGRVPGMTRGTVTVTVETAPGVAARADEIRPVTGPDDPDLGSKTTHNYMLANDRVLRRVEGAVEDGRYDVQIGALSPPAYVIKVYAVGHDERGAATDAFGALRVR